jgi:hypothetical protein
LVFQRPVAAKTVRGAITLTYRYGLDPVQWTRWHRTGLGEVVAGARDAQHLAALLHSEPGADEGIDHRVGPFGRSTSFPRSSCARRKISTSVSSSRMRRRALTSSFDSLVVHAGNLTSVDAVLFDPVVDGGRRDVEIVSGLGDRPTRSHKRNRSSSKLRGIGRWHGLSLSLRPNFNKQKGNKTQRRSFPPLNPGRFRPSTMRSVLIDRSLRRHPAYSSDCTLGAR